MAADFGIKGRVAVVTGGYGVLGGSLADALVAAGARVAVLGRNPESGEKKAAALRSAGGQAMAVVASALDEAELKAAREAVVKAWGGVDILVNAAGRTFRKPTVQVTEADWNGLMDTNLTGMLRACQSFYEPLAANKRGRVINIASLSRAICNCTKPAGGSASRRTRIC